MATAAGTFEITFGAEDAYQEADGVKLTRANGTQRFSGDIQGQGSVEWLMCYLPDGSASFAGLQRIDGSVGGRSGTFVMQASGSHDGSRSKATWSVIAGSGTNGLAGIRGEGSFDAPGGATANYNLGYALG